MRGALIRKSDNRVVNVVVVEEGFKPDTGFEFVESESANPGDTWDDKAKKFKKPDPPEPTRLEELEGKLSDDAGSFTLSEVVELLRLERGL